MKKVSVVLLISMGFVSSIWAVEETVTRNFDELLEIIYSQWEEYVAYEALQERLWECYNEPLSLNKVSREDLRLLCILTDNQLDQLFKHLIKNGPLISIYELQTIPGFDLATIRRLVPFIKIVTMLEDYESRSLWHKGLESKSDYGLVRYERTLEKRRGYQYNRKQHKVPYAGSPHKLFTQLSIKHADWALGVSGRKGAGEALTWNPAIQYYGLPNWRFYWLLNNKKRIKTLVIGDYAVGYGQGIILNAGFSMDKSSETVKVIRTNNLGIRPHTSVTTAAFRGVAITWQWQFMELTTYYSNIDLDASIKKTSYLKNVIRSGYYRTQGEIAKRKQINEQVIGSTIIYKDPIQGAELGINALYSQYSLPIYPNSSRSNPHSLCGQHHANGSIFYRYLWQNFHFFGEGALSLNRGKAVILGLVTSLSRYVDAALLWRHYGYNFHSPYGKAFRENSTSNSNEQGIYLGARISLWHHLHLDTYYDYFHSPWNLGKSHAGHSWLAKVTYQVSKTSRVFLQYKLTVKPRQSAQYTKAVAGTQQHCKCFGQYALSKAIYCKSEIQCNRYQHLGMPTWGYAAVQDATCKLHRLRFKGRVAWFNIKNPHNKLYFYEPNILHTGFNFRAYHGKGMRYCLLTCYQPTAIFRLELKYALTHYQGVKKISSGQETIQGNIQNDVTLQAIFKF